MIGRWWLHNPHTDWDVVLVAHERNDGRTTDERFDLFDDTFINVDHDNENLTISNRDEVFHPVRLQFQIDETPHQIDVRGLNLAPPWEERPSPSVWSET